MFLKKLSVSDLSLLKQWLTDGLIESTLPEDYITSIINYAGQHLELNLHGSNNMLFAVLSDENEYMGMVSLRYFDCKTGSAEFTIAVRECAKGRGYAWYGMSEVLTYAFNELNLEKVYWTVPAVNVRALRFFKKHGFNVLDEDIPYIISKRYNYKKNLVWFAVLKGDDYLNEAIKRKTIAGCQITDIKTIPTIEAGELSFFEARYDISFDIKRIYYISKVPEGVRRGFHAHKELKQILFCPYGKIQLTLDNGEIREDIILSDPSVGIIIDKPTWREMLWLEKNSVLVVAASDYYKQDDYIKNYDAFKDFIGSL